MIERKDGTIGSLTMIGTVSPAGGNFEEPVTQATLGTVKTFLGLSSDRAYKRFYPAIDPLISWSRYLDQLKPWYDKNVSADWVDDVKMMHDKLHRADAIYQMMQVTGEEGITIEDYIEWQKGTLVDIVFLQQDAFDDVDVSVPRARQEEAFALMKDLITRDYQFKDKDEAREFFTKITGMFKNYNYSPTDSQAYKNYMQEMRALADKHLAI